MKPYLSCLFLQAAALGALHANAQPEAAKQPVMRDAATHESLARKLRWAEQNDPMKAMPKSEGEDPSKVNRPQDLLEQSDIISFNGLATLVPKRAILATPQDHRERLAMQPGAKIVGWADFFAANRGWITTVEVSRAQAEGNQALAEDLREKIGKSRNLVVATFLGGPISVLPPKTEPAAAAADGAKPESKPEPAARP
jgi:hypothetical protein